MLFWTVFIVCRRVQPRSIGNPLYDHLPPPLPPLYRFFLPPTSFLTIFFLSNFPNTGPMKYRINTKINSWRKIIALCLENLELKSLIATVSHFTDEKQCLFPPLPWFPPILMEGDRTSPNVGIRSSDTKNSLKWGGMPKTGWGHKKEGEMRNVWKSRNCFMEKRKKQNK